MLVPWRACTRACTQFASRMDQIFCWSLLTVFSVVLAVLLWVNTQVRPCFGGQGTLAGRRTPRSLPVWLCSAAGAAGAGRFSSRKRPCRVGALQVGDHKLMLSGMSRPANM